MNARRLPAIAVFVLLITAALLADDPRPPVEAPPPDPLGAAMPAAAPAGALESTWYCAGGTSNPDGVADHTVVIANASAVPTTAVITVYPGALDTDPKRAQVVAQGSKVTTVDVGAWARASVHLADVLQAPVASALVEVAGGDVAVEHMVAGPDGVDESPCASSASGAWYFPSGATTLDTHEILVLFNPFPDAATVDLTFATDDGFRKPEQYDGLVVPGRSSLGVDITPVVTRRGQVAANVRARFGRVVADRLQLFDGSAGIRGMTVTLGAPQPGTRWMFPDGRVEDGITEIYNLYNPGEVDAEVDVAMVLDDPAVNGEVEPFDVLVPAGTYAQLVLNNEQRIPPGVSHSAVVHSRNGVPIVAERIVRAGEPSARAGMAATIGAPLDAIQWVLAAGAANDAVDEWLVVLNTSDSISRVSLTSLQRGQRLAIAGLQDLEIAAGGRLAIRLGDHIASDELTLVVEATQPVVVERGLYQVGAVGISQSIGIPLAPA